MQRTTLFSTLFLATILAGCANAVTEDSSPAGNDLGYANLQIQSETLFESFKLGRCPINSDYLRVKECSVTVERITDDTASVRQIASVVSPESPAVGASFLVICNYRLDGAGFAWTSGTTTSSVFSAPEDDVVESLNSAYSIDGSKLCP